MIDTDVLFADKYKLETKLGEGGMGEVWIARNIHLEKRVALKVMGRAVSTNVEFVERFLREAVIASRVRHPAIVEVFDAGQHQGTPWIAMELLEGESLAKRLERGAIPVAELVPLLVPILDALHALHEVGVIHRDVKPENILLDEEGKTIEAPIQNDMQVLHTFTNDLNFLDVTQKLKVAPDGTVMFNFGKYTGQSVKDIFKKEPSYYHWMLEREFSSQVKQLIKGIMKEI